VSCLTENYLGHYEADNQRADNPNSLLALF